MFKNLHTSPLPSVRIELSTFKHYLSSNSTRYIELEIFKQQLHVGELNYQYTFAECSYKIRNYRTIFLAIGVLFLCLACLIYEYNLVFFTDLFGNLRFLAKGFLIGLSLTFSFAASFIGYSLCVAREASTHQCFRAKRKLYQIYTQKRLEEGVSGLFNIGTFCSKHYSLKNKYQEVLHQIEEIKENTVPLLKKIQHCENIDTQYRELLFNQALCEMQDHLRASIQSFKQN